MNRTIFHPRHISNHIKNARTKFTKWKRKKKELHTLLIVIAIIFIWRGIWGLLDVYLLPNYPLLSMIISIIIGLIILYMDDKKLEGLVE